MKICKVCKTENEEQFIYCKNCGAQLEMNITPNYQTSVESKPTDTKNIKASNPYENISFDGPQNNSPASANIPVGLVGVKMLLPNPVNPEEKTIQTVYVTPAQKAAIQYDISKQNDINIHNTEKIF